MSENLRVLIVEDEPLISMTLGDLIEDTLPADVVIKSCVREARKVMDEPFDLALLDIDVTNGKTYEIARALGRKNVPYVFITGSLKEHLPVDLVDVPFIGKPFTDDQIIATVLAADVRRKVHFVRSIEDGTAAGTPRYSSTETSQEESRWTRNT
jgi:DNA-binding response OmpR family regulator